jgi:copper chaperone
MAANGELTIRVPDMSCEHCRETVASAVSGVESVSDVEVDLEAKLVVARGAAIVSEDVREAIAAAGYTPGPE